MVRSLHEQSDRPVRTEAAPGTWPDGAPRPELVTAVTFTTTSFRLSPDELELLDAQAQYLLERHGLKYNRTDVIRNMMRAVKPPTDGVGGDGARRFREAYSTIFGKQEP